MAHCACWAQGGRQTVPLQARRVIDGLNDKGKFRPRKAHGDLTFGRVGRPLPVSSARQTFRAKTRPAELVDVATVLSLHARVTSNQALSASARARMLRLRGSLRWPALRALQTRPAADKPNPAAEVASITQPSPSVSSTAPSGSE